MRRKPVVLPAVARHASPRVSAQPDARTAMLQGIDAKRDALRRHRQSRSGAFAEVGYQETKSSALLQQQLKRRRLRGDGAASPASRPRLSRRSDPASRSSASSASSTRCPACRRKRRPATRHAIEENAPGHGCGHNLLGTGALAAAVAVKEWLASGHAGTLRYYGTPAEEGGSGKVYMVRAGLFKDVDAVVSWHPGDRNEASPTSSTANITGKFRFHGVAAHAAAAPDRGRSALDAVEAMDYMVNMMREHVPQETRIHYIITRGGAAPNIVPDFAEVYYYARQPNMRDPRRHLGAHRQRRQGRGARHRHDDGARGDRRGVQRAAERVSERRDARQPRAGRRLHLHPGGERSSPRSFARR